MRRSIMVLLLALMASVGPPGGPARAQDDTNPLLDLLAFVTQASDAESRLVTYGDFAAWHAATGIPRVHSVAAADALPEPARAWWLFVMPRQTVPPEVLGVQYLFHEDMRPVYGFDLFAVDRFVALETPPSNITVLETALEPARVGEALLATGYEAEALDGGTLFRILGDYELALGADLPRVGMLGTLNRIAVLDDGTLVIARATERVQAALDTRQGAQPSLAGDARYRVAAEALHRLSRSDLGALVGAIFSEEVVAGDPLALEPGATAEDEEAAPDAAPLPPYTLAAFGTFRGTGATFLALAVVFPPGTDASAAAITLSDRMAQYVSLVTQAPLSERWTFDRAFADESGTLPVAVVVMRVDDPPPPAEGEQVNTAILAWTDLVYRRDLGFLVPGPDLGN